MTSGLSIDFGNKNRREKNAMACVYRRGFMQLSGGGLMNTYTV